MHKTALLPLLLSLLLPGPAQAEPVEDYDYFLANRMMIRNGLQAVLMCNGLFTSERSLQQVFTQELAYVTHPVGTALSFLGRAVHAGIWRLTSRISRGEKTR